MSAEMLFTIGQGSSRCTWPRDSERRSASGVNTRRSSASCRVPPMRVWGNMEVETSRTQGIAVLQASVKVPPIILKLFVFMVAAGTMIGCLRALGLLRRGLASRISSTRRYWLTRMRLPANRSICESFGMEVSESI
ncbi:hypothetical protein BU23DRAFT_216325 [Bimuria novae-zelandiae CBS 107.79]|uniref:Uncharacterized protein n=1 Tax=Bimuria novae-zelandiae CBS 107.79 TaxID=1447943 RepID=A0A6A5V298_9PLEO|nr:hypothetical protein BU23DRAFT_216325 [Bimuria novae-zelandiae CBS 107.79]